jgi:hypothetical protein
MKVDGACHCGQITYTAEVDPETVVLCHCTDCQRLSGTAFRSVVPAPAAGFKLLTGQPKLYMKTAESGNKRIQAFCPECGTSVYSAAAENTPAYSLRLGALRQRAQLTPKTQIWCRSALTWVMDLGSIKQIPKQPG